MNSTPESVADLVHRYYEEALNAGNWTMLETLVAPAFAGHDSLTHIPPTRDGIRQKYELLRSGFPDLHFRVEDIIVSEDRAAARVTVSGTHSLPFMGRLANGREFKATEIYVFRVVDHQITESWGVFDQFSMLAQLGAFASPA